MDASKIASLLGTVIPLIGTATQTAVTVLTELQELSANGGASDDQLDALIAKAQAQDETIQES